jgi:hypothetical protein
MIRNTPTLSILAACLIVVFQGGAAVAQQSGQFGKTGGASPSVGSRKQHDGSRFGPAETKSAVKLATPAASRACEALAPEVKQIGKGLYAILVAIGAGFVKVFLSLFGSRSAATDKKLE